MEAHEIFLSVMSVVTPLITVASFWLAVKNSKKGDAKDIEVNAESRAEIKVKLDLVLKGMDDMREELKSNRTTMAELSEQITRVEESAKQAHKRIDELMHGKNI